jgi:hypothetical protein
MADAGVTDEASSWEGRIRDALDTASGAGIV